MACRRPVEMNDAPRANSCTKELDLGVQQLRIDIDRRTATHGLRAAAAVTEWHVKVDRQRRGFRQCVEPVRINLGPNDGGKMRGRRVGRVRGTLRSANASILSMDGRLTPELSVIE
jgi:hypothetical protein